MKLRKPRDGGGRGKNAIYNSGRIHDKEETCRSLYLSYATSTTTLFLCNITPVINFSPSFSFLTLVQEDLHERALKSR